MITPKELKEKAERPFYKIISSELRGETAFPWIVPSNKQITGSNYSDWKNDLIPLHQQSKAAKKIGYTIEWKEKKINGSLQSVPSKIYFETLEDYLHFVGKSKDYEKIKTAQQILLAEFPKLKEWTEDNPALLLTYHDVWQDIVWVCRYMLNNAPPHDFYIRELPISVHSKFVEDYQAILKKILDLMLPSNWIKPGEKDFALRYGFRKPSIHTQIRVLDDELKPFLGYEECSLPIDDAAWLKWLPEKVFIVENQICYLTFPKKKNAVAIFGEGFKTKLAKHIPWLEKTELYCWFDLDAAGFEMLNMVRQHYPNVRNFLMNIETYNFHARYSVHNTSRLKSLTLLTLEEQAFYQFLVSNKIRLEQEKISHKYVMGKIVTA